MLLVLAAAECWSIVAARHAGSGANLRSHITWIRLLQARRNCQLVQNHPDLMSLSIREIDAREGKIVTDEYTEDTQLEQIHIYDKGSALFATCSEQYRKLKKKGFGSIFSFWAALVLCKVT